MLCPNCGKDNDAGTVFCINCGSKIPAAQSSDAAYGEAPPQQNGQFYPAASRSDSAVLSMGEFTLMELIARIPIVNLVMFCVWGFGSDTNENKRNWARSRLIWLGIGVALTIIGTLIGVGMASALAAGFSSFADAIFY